jgi:serine/threonine protein kinase
MNGRWQKWAQEIAKAVACLHEQDEPHMDLKPSNIVMSAAWKAVLIDISGIDGVSNEWLSPTMQKTAEPLEQSVEARKQNDIWAMGKIFLAMAARTGCEWERELLEQVARDAMQANPKSLQEILSQLDRHKS